ncbi:MAG TPA: DUF2252 family protein [Polyangiaceae bacterium]|jgi:hypothetical protein
MGDTTLLEATTRYEAWLAEQLEIVPEDLTRKHVEMTKAAFPFLRATFYRWAEQWPSACPELLNATRVVSIGDLHVENFGTWRDAEGRLIWGVNDFDECFPLPWTHDLVRLSTSALLAIDAQRLSVKRAEACTAILSGYTESLTTRGEPFVLAEKNRRLRKIAVERLRDPGAFWAKLDALPTWTGSVPESALTALRESLPDPALACRIVHRVAGLGSLGRHRFVALADFRGGRIARESKAWAPSACAWATAQSEKVRYSDRILCDAPRAHDPFLKASPAWTTRRLAPDCARIELGELPAERDEPRLLEAMGFELGNLHLADPNAANVLGELQDRSAGWLLDAAKRMSKLVSSDWESWRASGAAR